MAFKFLSSRKIGVVKSPKLYNSIDQIKATLFFRIMKTSEISLLNQTPEIQVEKQILEETWEQLLEDYSIASNALNYKSKLIERKNIEIIRNKLTTLHACLLLSKLNDIDSSQTIVDTLLYFGLPGDLNAQQLQQIINRENSYLKLLLSSKELEQNETGKTEEINFYRLVAKYEEATGEHIDSENIILAHWIEKVKLLKNKKPNSNGRRK